MKTYDIIIKRTEIYRGSIIADNAEDARAKVQLMIDDVDCMDNLESEDDGIGMSHDDYHYDNNLEIDGISEHVEVG